MVQRIHVAADDAPSACLSHHKLKLRTERHAVVPKQRYRRFWQAHVDSNGTDAQPCDPGGLFPGQLCIGDGMTQINQNLPVPNTLSPNAFLGEIDRNWTSTGSFGGSAQAASVTKLLDHENHFLAGVSLDHGNTQFAANSELGTIDQNLFVTGTGSLSTNRPRASPLSISRPRTRIQASTRLTPST
jgi:iron complex outermembrane recepter protein